MKAKRYVAKPAYDPSTSPSTSLSTSSRRGSGCNSGQCNPKQLFVEEKASGRFYIATIASSERLRRLAKCHPYRVIIHD